jgi:hypothetical protein
MGLSHSPGIVTSGLVYSIDAANSRSYSGSGITVNGLVGIGGTLINGVGFTSTNSGSFVFDGTNDYINPAFPVSNNSDFTIGFWMNYQDVTSPERGILVTWDTSYNGFGIGTAGGQIRSWVGNGGGGGIDWGAITTNTWKYYIVAYNYSLKTQYVYVNGNFVISGVNSNFINHSSLQIARGGQSGSSQLSSYTYLKCQISQLSIYNRPLSATEIRQNFNATRKRYGI